MGTVPNETGPRITDNTPAAPPPEPFSEQDNLLIDKTEEAIRDGLQLERWCRTQREKLALFPLDLKKKYALPNRAEGFFSELPINDTTRSVMGCSASPSP